MEMTFQGMAQDRNNLQKEEQKHDVICLYNNWISHKHTIIRTYYCYFMTCTGWQFHVSFGESRIAEENITLLSR